MFGAVGRQVVPEGRRISQWIRSSQEMPPTCSKTDAGHPKVSPSAPKWPASVFERSEEHTSELQSRGHVVCRLLLEKKKKTLILTPARQSLGLRPADSVA